jgi:hypothetical protein
MTQELERNKKSKKPFQPDKIDLILATIAALGMPFLCAWLYEVTGALIPLIIYYGVFCFGIILWRKRTLNYSIPIKFFSKEFFIVFFFEIIRMILAFLTLIRIEHFNPLGFFLTLIVWAPLNAFTEQLLWIYVFESFSSYSKDEKTNKFLTILGLILYILLIAFIHIFFWSKFLLHSESVFPFSVFFILINFAIAIGYLFLYKKHHSMLQIFILHLIGDASGVIIAGYSIIPYLF